MNDNRHILLGLFTALLLVLPGCEEAPRGSRMMNSSTLQQVGAQVTRMATVMVIAEKTTIEGLRFNTPDEFSDLKDPKTGVFHPEGGGVRYWEIPAELMADGHPGRLNFNAEFEIEGVEEDHEREDHGDIVAFGIGVNEKICRHINDDREIEGIPQLRSNQAPLYTRRMIDRADGSYELPVGASPVLDSPDLVGKFEGCFESNAGDALVYYRLILPR